MNIRKIDLHSLYTLLVLLEEQNVSRCAIRLNLSQPTVSHTLARLRSVLNDPLFTRTRHGLLPTTRALALEPELRSLFNSVESILQPDVFDQSTCSATIVLSANDYMQFAVLAPAIQAIRRRAPHMRIAIRQAERAELVPMLENGQIDLALTIPEFSDKRLRSQHLYDERYVVAMRKRHPLTKRKLTIDEFINVDHAIVSPTEGQFQGPTDHALGALGLKRNVVLSVASFFTLIELISRSDTVALIPERLSNKFAGKLSYAAPPLEVQGFEVIMAWSNKTHLDPIRHWVREQIGTAAK